MGPAAVSKGENVTLLGAGVIGLSLALELHRRGFTVELQEQRVPARGASWAAAGMLAAEDPHNPPALAALARYSVGLYPQFLASLREASGVAVPFQTDTTVQTDANGERQVLAEHSIDPRQLMQALVTAVQQARIPVRLSGEAPEGATVVHTTGAWAQRFAVRPRKGQMLRVQLPEDARFTEVYRAAHVYVVPRTQGAQAGTALLGATIEDSGFDATVHEGDLARLRQTAAALVPEVPALADAHATPTVEAWAGLRPATADGLPLLGKVSPTDGERRTFVAVGHFRNGILLAPGTAAVLANLLLGEPPAVDLSSFDPGRPGLLP